MFPDSRGGKAHCWFDSTCLLYHRSYIQCWAFAAAAAAADLRPQRQEQNHALLRQLHCPFRALVCTQYEGDVHGSANKVIQEEATQTVAFSLLGMWYGRSRFNSKAMNSTHACDEKSASDRASSDEQTRKVEKANPWARICTDERRRCIRSG